MGLPIGVAIGIVLGLVGSGGAILATPLLVLVGNFSFALASTGALFVVFFASVTAVLLRGVKKTHLKIALIGIALGAVGAVPGAWLANQISEGAALVILVGILVLAAIASWNNEALPKSSSKLLNRILLVTLFVLTGLLTGLTGVGGGYILIPGLLVLTALGFRESVSVSLLIIIGNSLISLAIRFSQDVEISIDQTQVIAIVVVSAIIGSVIGAKLSFKTNRKIAQRSFAILALALALVVTLEVFLVLK